MIRPAPYFACPNHTLLNNASMNLLIRLTSLRLFLVTLALF